MLSLIDSLKTYRNRKRFKRGSIVRVIDKRRNLNFIGVLSKFDNNIAYLFMVYHLGNYCKFFDTTHGVTAQISTLHKPSQEELEEYLDYTYNKLSLIYVPWMRLFRKFPNQYVQGEDVFLAMCEKDTYADNCRMKFDRYERVGSSSLYKVYCIGEEVQFSSDNIYPVEYNRAML